MAAGENRLATGGSQADHGRIQCLVRERLQVGRILNGLAFCGGVGSHRPTGRETLENGGGQGSATIARASASGTAFGWGICPTDYGGGWQCPTNSLHRLFKVTVEMP